MGSPGSLPTDARELTTAAKVVHDKGMTRYDPRWSHMPRNRKAITFSLPPEMDEQVRQFIHEEDRTMSEFLREAIRLYMDEQEWLRRERRQRAEVRRKAME